MRLIFGQDKAVAEWTMRRIPYMNEIGPFTAIGVARDGVPVAGVIYHGYDKKFDTMMMSIAADTPRWAQRGVLLGLLHYPFEQLRVRKLWAIVASSNKRALRFDKGIGFTQEAILARHFGKDHAVVLRMFRADYEKFKQRMRNGEEQGRR